MRFHWLHPERFEELVVLMMAGIRRSHQFFSDKDCTRPREKARRHRSAESSLRPALRRTRDASWTGLERRQLMTQVDAESGILPSAMNLAKNGPAPAHGENGFYDQGGGDPRERVATGDLIDHCGAQRSFLRIRAGVGKRFYYFLCFKRFHSNSESCSISRSIFWWFFTASRMRPAHCRGTNNCRNFPRCRRTR